MVERRLRLRAEADVRRVRARGRAWADGPLVVRVLANPAGPPGAEPPANRYAVVAGKKVGGAVERNRCKRLVREAIRRLHPRLAPGYDLVVIVRGGPDELSGLAVAEAALGRVAARARLLRLEVGESGSREVGKRPDTSPTPRLPDSPTPGGGP